MNVSAAGAMSQSSRRHAAGSRARRARAVRWLWRGVSLAFIALIVWLIADKGFSMDWAAVGSALRNYEWPTLLGAALLALAGHVAAATYDLVGKRCVDHPLPDRQVFAINFIAYAFSINLGGVLGGWGTRMRLYSRFSLKARQIARIIALAFVTNWSGFILLSAIVLLWPLRLPVDLAVEQVPWRLAASVLLFSTVIAYLLVCRFGHDRHWRIRIRDLSLRLPPIRLALVQLGLSSASWLLMALTLDHLLPQQVPFNQVLAVLFLGSVIGAASHVPGSLGVLEASVLWLFGAQAEPLNVLAALLAYRALYYLVPLLIAAIGFGVMESLARRWRTSA